MSNDFLDGLKVNVEPRSKVSEFLDVAVALHSEGYNLRKIPQKMGGRKESRWTTIADLDLPETIFNKYPQLRAEYQIGRNINDMKRLMAGKIKLQCTEEQLSMLNDYLGGKKTAMQELVEVMEILDSDIKNEWESIIELQIQLRNKNIGITLGRLFFDGLISQEGRNRLVEKGYDADFPIGQRIIGARRLIDGSKTNYVATPKEIEELKKYIRPSRAYTKDN